MESHKLQFFFCLVFFPPLRKGEAGGLGTADIWNQDLSNELTLSLATKKA